MLQTAAQQAMLLQKKEQSKAHNRGESFSIKSKFRAERGPSSRPIRMYTKGNRKAAPSFSLFLSKNAVNVVFVNQKLVIQCMPGGGASRSTPSTMLRCTSLSPTRVRKNLLARSLSALTLTVSSRRVPRSLTL